MYHDRKSVNVFGDTERASLHAGLVYDCEATEEATYANDYCEPKEGINPLYPELDGICHQSSHNLADTEQDEILTDLLPQFRHDHISPIINILTIYPQNNHWNSDLL